MPLNPNGKIDKPALPFPDTAQAASAERPRGVDAREATPTEEAMRGIWARILPSAPSPIPLDENFFDLGGHSILATRLIFEIRKTFVVNAPLGLVFDRPTIGGMAAEVDALRNSDLAFAYKDGGTGSPPSALLSVPGVKNAAAPAMEYWRDYEALASKLRSSYGPLPGDFGTRPVTVFLTGATGFLGAFIMRDLLSRRDRVAKVICLVRAGDRRDALARLRELSSDRGVWEEEWIPSGRVQVVEGDLNLPCFGLGEDEWIRVGDEVDVVVHNGALVSKTE